MDATGSDLDGDVITYLWEQNDPGGGAIGSPLLDATKANGPLFRIFGDDPGVGANAAGVVPSRSFPDIDQVLADNTNAATGACAVDVAWLFGTAADRRLGRHRRVPHAALPPHRARQPSRLRRGSTAPTSR